MTKDPTNRRLPGLAGNLRLYDRHAVASSAFFALPTTILFFLSRVGLGATLRLTAVHFLTVVVLEVPSGWLSDRFGRVLTLRLAATSWVAAFATFLVAGSAIALLAVAQVLFALGFALLSGTTASFHYDTLEVLGRSSEFERREGRAMRNAFLATTAAAAVGGSLGIIDLRLPFAAALVAALYQLTLALRMTESVAVPREARRPDPTSPGQIRSCFAYLRRRGLAWLFLFMTLQQPLEGLVLDLIQPWLAELAGASFTDLGAAPLYSGLLIATISIVGAGAAAKSHRLREALGLRGALVLLASIEALILIGMATIVSPWLFPLLALRSTQAAAAPVLVASAAAPHVAMHHRATFLSLGSLAGRLLYGVVLVSLGFIEGLDQVLMISAAIGVASVVVLVAASRVFGRDDLTSTTPLS